MDDEPKKRYLAVKELFNRMSHEISSIVESYRIWRTLTFSRSIPETGQEQADKNAKLLSLYKDFFIPTEQSHLQTFIVGLMKFFDKNPQALSFAGLVKELEKNKDIFTPDLLKEMNPNLARFGSVKDDYVPVTQDTVDALEQLRTSHAPLISNLKNVRDKQFAHTDMKTIKGTFVPNEVEELIKGVQEMFNRLSNDFDLSATVWDHLEDESVRSTKFVMENLQRGEVARMEEIQKKWGSLGASQGEE